MGSWGRKRDIVHLCRIGSEAGVSDHTVKEPFHGKSRGSMCEMRPTLRSSRKLASREYIVRASIRTWEEAKSMFRYDSSFDCPRLHPPSIQPTIYPQTRRLDNQRDCSCALRFHKQPDHAYTRPQQGERQQSTRRPKDCKEGKRFCRGDWRVPKPVEDQSKYSKCIILLASCRVCKADQQDRKYPSSQAREIRKERRESMKVKESPDRVPKRCIAWGCAIKYS